MRRLLRSVRRPFAKRFVRDDGMSTAEYAVGTVAACAFAALLYKVVTSQTVQNALDSLIHRALNVAF